LLELDPCSANSESVRLTSSSSRFERVPRRRGEEPPETGAGDGPATRLRRRTTRWRQLSRFLSKSRKRGWRAGSLSLVSRLTEENAGTLARKTRWSGKGSANDEFRKPASAGPHSKLETRNSHFRSPPLPGNGDGRGSASVPESSGISLLQFFHLARRKVARCQDSVGQGAAVSVGLETGKGRNTAVGAPPLYRLRWRGGWG
jgi:hypothetical protein